MLGLTPRFAPVISIIKLRISGGSASTGEFSTFSAFLTRVMSIDAVHKVALEDDLTLCGGMRRRIAQEVPKRGICSRARNKSLPKN